MTGGWPERIVLAWALLAAGVGGGRAADPAAFDDARRSVLERYAAGVRQQDPAFAGFSAAAGQAFFLARPAGAQPATPSCSACHYSIGTTVARIIMQGGGRKAFSTSQLVALDVERTK